jgi:hypothetical protein
MSLRAMTWAWTVQVPPTPKLVLMALADEADDAGYCFPSQRRIAAKSSVSVRTVRRMVAQLIGQGHMNVEVRLRADGSRTSNGYRLTLPPDKLTGGADMHVRRPRTPLSWDGDTAVRALPTTDPLSNPPQPHGSDNAKRGESNTEKRCTEVDWDFPPGISPGEIEALRDALQGVDPSRGQELLDELAGRLKTGKIANPIRYCAALVRRLSDGKFKPELGIRVAEARAKERQDLERRSGRASVDSAVLQATIQRLPEQLRDSLERMRKHVQGEADERQPIGSSGGEET